MNARLAVIGLVIAVILAIGALWQQQLSVQQAQQAHAEATDADTRRVTAVAMMQEASGTQVAAEVGQATAQAAAEAASTAQGVAEANLATAQADREAAATLSAQIGLTATTGAEAAAATLAEAADQQATIVAQATTMLVTAQAERDTLATQQADTAALLATATAQLDLAVFAQEAAEEDREIALAQAWALGTAQAETRTDLATAQAIIEGVTPLPPTAIPPTVAPEQRPTSTPQPDEAPPQTTGDVFAPDEVFQAELSPLRVQYPGEWVVQELDNGVVFIGTDEGIYQRSAEEALVTGDFEIDMFISTREDLGFVGAELSEILSGFIDFVQQQDSTIDFGRIQNITIEDRDAVRSFGQDSRNDLVITVMQLEDDYVNVSFVYVPRESGPDAEAQIDVILETVALQ
jgi:hypothetical protein